MRDDPKGLRYKFDEDYYLITNPDVAQDVKKGVWESGYAHWLAAGAKEGRLPYPPWTEYNLPAFDEDLYIEANPDVAAAVRNGEIGFGFQHFVLFGWKEIATGLRGGNPDQRRDVICRLTLRDRMFGILNSPYEKTQDYIRGELNGWFAEAIRQTASKEVEDVLISTEKVGRYDSRSSESAVAPEQTSA